MDRAHHNSPRWSTCRHSLIRCKWWVSKESEPTSKSRWCSNRCSISKWIKMPSRLRPARCSTNSFYSSSKWVTRHPIVKLVTISTLRLWRHLVRSCLAAVKTRPCMEHLPLSLLKFMDKSSSICNSRIAAYPVRSVNASKGSSTQDSNVRVITVAQAAVQRCNLENRYSVCAVENADIDFHTISASLWMIKG